MSAVLAPPPTVAKPPARRKPRKAPQPVPASAPVTTPATRPAPIGTPSPQRFTFEGVDRAFYEQVDARVGPGVFVTYYKGTLEIVATSLLHDRTSRVLYRLICVLAEEAEVPMCSAGSATLREPGDGDGVQGDEAFYFGDNVERMRPRTEAGGLIDFAAEPPPDLAIEVEVTARLGTRFDIYRELGVPEVWRFNGALTVLLLRDGQYEPADRSPTFPQLSPQEIAGFVAAGLRGEEGAAARQFRKRVREAMGV